MSVFGKKLKTVIQQLSLNQAQVVCMTGCSKGSISQYLSGKNTPPADKQRDIAVSLGLAPDYFEREEIQPIIPPTPKQSNDEGVIPQLRVKDVAKFFRKSHETISRGLQQGRFPWGYAIQMPKGGWSYFINKRRFMRHEVECDTEEFKQLQKQVTELKSMVNELIIIARKSAA